MITRRHFWTIRPLPVNFAEPSYFVASCRYSLKGAYTLECTLMKIYFEVFVIVDKRTAVYCLTFRVTIFIEINRKVS